MGTALVCKRKVGSDCFHPSSMPLTGSIFGSKVFVARLRTEELEGPVE